MISVRVMTVIQEYVILDSLDPLFETSEGVCGFHSADR